MEYNKLVSGEALSKEKFLTPSKEFGIMPFWFWNGEMKYEEIEYQLREYKEKGCPATCVSRVTGRPDWSHSPGSSTACVMLWCATTCARPGSWR